MKKVVILLLCASFSFSSTISAADPPQKQRLTVAPSLVDIELAPGESIAKELTAVNKGTEAAFLSVSIAPYSVRDETEEPYYETLPGAPNVTKWVTITAPRERVHLAPEAVQEISYTVSIPPSTSPGGYLFAIFATTTPAESSESVTVQNRIAVINYITVKGDVQPSGQVTTSPLQRLSWDGMLHTEFTVKNTGSMHFAATTTAIVKTLWGNEVGRVEDKRHILPFTEKRIELDWRSPYTLGIYRVDRSASYSGHTERFPTDWLIVIHPLILAGTILLITGLSFFIAKHRHRKRSILRQ